MSNAQRTTFLRGVIAEGLFSESLADHLDHSIRCYEICLSNRNIIAHSILAPDLTYLAFEMTKARKEINTRRIDPDAEFLEGVAGEIEDTSTYLSDLEDHLHSKKPVSCEKPPLPRDLSVLFPHEIIGGRQ